MGVPHSGQLPKPRIHLFQNLAGLSEFGGAHSKRLLAAALVWRISSDKMSGAPFFALQMIAFSCVTS
jgi:hypothetical protein